MRNKNIKSAILYKFVQNNRLVKDLYGKINFKNEILKN